MIKDVCVISTGTEILQGLYEDSNARYLAEQLTAMGLHVKNILTAPDDEKVIENTIRFAASTADLIVCTGGLGPTEDDRNRFVFARIAGVEAVHNEAALEMIKERFTVRGRPFPENNRIQAAIPEGAVVLKNEWGTAPGFILTFSSAENRKTTLVALPGPPAEMKPMFEEKALPIIRPMLEGNSFGKVRTYHTFGFGESDINEKVKDLFHYDPTVQFTILSRSHGIDLRVHAVGETSEAVEQILNRYDDMIYGKLSAREIYGTDDQTLPTVVSGQLFAEKKTVATAESCTSGLVGKLLTDFAGCSLCYEQGFITYSNDSKVELLGVNRETLRMHGAVSEETASEMAVNVRQRANSYYGLSVTGISGPTGGTDKKPVGLTFWAVSSPEGCWVEHKVFPGNRDQNRQWAAYAVLNLLRKVMNGLQD